MKQYLLPKKNVLTLITFIFFLCSFNSLVAQKTASTGNWNTAGTWSPSGVPSSSDIVNIPAGVTLTVDVTTATCASIVVNTNTSGNNTATLKFNSGSILTVAGNVTLGNGGQRKGSLDMTSGGTLKIGGTGTIIISMLGAFTPGTGTIEYNGGSQTIESGITPYNNLTLSGTAGTNVKTVTGVDINGKLSIQGTSTITGAIGTYGSASTLEYKGSVAQTTGTEFPSTLSGTGGLIIDNTAGVTLDADRTIANNVTFTNGKLITNGNTLILTKATPLTAIVNATSTKYVVGELQFALPVGTTTSLLYPIGTASIYAPATITATVTGSIANLAINVATGFSANDPVGTQPSGINRTNYAGVYWSLNKTGGTVSSYTPIFNFSNASPAGTVANYKFRNYNGTAWSDIASPTIASNTITKAGLTAFGDFEAGIANTLSVTTQPSNATVCPSGTSSYTAASTSLPAPAIQWQGKAPAGSFANVSGGVYSGETTGTLSISNNTGLGGYQYQAVFTNINGTATSSAANLTLKINPGIVSATAAASPICSSATTSITANTITGTNAVLIWWTGTGGTGTNLGSTNPLTVGPGTYYARVTGDCSPAAEAVVTVAAKVNPGITSVTAGANPICSSTTTSITANGITGTNASLVWRTGPNGTGTNLGSTNPLTVGPGTYYARVTGDCTPAAEVSITITAKTNVSITSATATATPICTSATTTVTANGVAGTNAVLTWWTGTGGSGANLGSANPLTVGPGTYYARVTGDCGGPVETSVTVASKTNVSITSATATASPICSSSTTNITANGVAGTNAVLTWWTGTGGTGTNLGSANPLTVGPGTYYARITGDCGGPVETSVTVAGKTNVSITSATAAASPICNSSTTTITANGIAGTNAVLTWRAGPGGTGSNLGSTNPLTVGPGTYYARVTGDCGSPVETSVTVAAKTDAGITNATSAANPICSNGTTTVTANGVVGTNAVLTWWTGSNGTGTNLGSANPLTVGPGTYYARVTADCGSPVQAMVNIAGANGYRWTGAVDNDHTNPANWYCGVVPPPDAAVTLDPNTTMTLATDFTVGDLTMNSGAKVNLNGHKIKIDGTHSGGEFVGSNNSDLEIGATGNAASISFATGNQKLHNLTVSGNATFATTVDIAGGSTPGRVIVNAGATLNTGDNLRLKSDINGTATIGNSAGTINGKVEVERYFKQNTYRGWRLIAIPVDGNSQTIRQSWQEGATSYNSDPNPGFGTRITSSVTNAVTIGYDAKTPGNSLLYYTGSAWAGFTGNLITTDISRHANGDAWMLYVRGSRAVDTATAITGSSETILRVKGNLYTAPYPIVTIPAGANGLVGNILPSEIDFLNVNISGGADNAFYVWDPKLYGSYGLGGYQTFSASTPIPWKPVPGGGSYGTTPNTKIQLGMGFFVHATGSTGFVQLTENSKSAGTNANATGFRPMAPQAVIPYLEADLYAVSGTTENLADGSIVGFDNTYSNNVDNKDNVKVAGFGDGLGILRGSSVLSAEQRKPIVSGDIIPFRLTNLKKQAYKLNIVASGLGSNGTTAVLEDKYLNTTTALNLDASTSVSFNADPAVVTSFTDRFRIVFIVPTPVTIINLTAQQKNTTVAVDWKTAVENGVKQYDIERSQDGSNFSKVGVVTATANNGGAATYHFADATPATGLNYYRIKTIDLSGAVKFTNVVKVAYGKNAQGISLVSTMITDGTINIRLYDQVSGKYFVKLTNLLGQKFLKTSFEHTEGSSTKSITVPTLNKGTYLLEIVTPNGKKTIEKVIMN